MLRLVLSFFIVAIIAAIFGFSGIAETSVDIAQIIFFIFATLLVITLILSVFDKKKPPKI